jgi:HD-like signal output (HDOD) protein
VSHTPGIEEVVHAVTKLSSLPALHSRILSVLSDPTSSMANLAPLLDKDPGLTARILRRSNSSYYGRRGTITTVMGALPVLGVGQLRDLVLSSSIVNVFQKLPQTLLSMEEFWKHSVLVGILARELAVVAGIPDPDEVNTAGLLHDVGRLVIIQAMPVEYHKLLLFSRAASKPLVLVEYEHLGFTHAQAGGNLFTTWGLPLSISQAAEHHHRPDQIHRHREIVELVQLADVLAHGLQIGSSGETRIPPFDAERAQELLPTPRMVQVLRHAESAVDDVMATLFP